MFRRHHDQCVARFAADEVAVLRQVASEVIGLLTDNFDRDDPVVERLFPDGYADNPAESAEFRRYTEGDLKTAKIDQAGAILATLPSDGRKLNPKKNCAAPMRNWCCELNAAPPISKPPISSWKTSSRSANAWKANCLKSPKTSVGESVLICMMTWGKSSRA